MGLVSEKKFAASLSVGSNMFLISAKLFAGISTGSISILSEALHSSSDLMASILALFSVSKSSKPADKGHPHGHGKIEDFSGFIEGLLIIGASAFILYEALNKLYTGADGVLDTRLGIIVMLISVIANYFVSGYIMKVSERSDSIALYADAQHLRMDVYSSLAVLFGLIAIKLTGNFLIDPILAILVSLFVFRTGYKICKESVRNLLDSSLPEAEGLIIKELVKNYKPKGVLNLRSLKTRKSGMVKKIELILEVPEQMTIKEGHFLCDEIEDDIENNLKNTDVIIHLEA